MAMLDACKRTPREERYLLNSPSKLAHQLDILRSIIYDYVHTEPLSSVVVDASYDASLCGEILERTGCLVVNNMSTQAVVDEVDRDMASVLFDQYVPTNGSNLVSVREKFLDSKGGVNCGAVCARRGLLRNLPGNHYNTVHPTRDLTKDQEVYRRLVDGKTVLLTLLYSYAARPMFTYLTHQDTNTDWFRKVVGNDTRLTLDLMEVDVRSKPSHQMSVYPRDADRIFCTLELTDMEEGTFVIPYSHEGRVRRVVEDIIQTMVYADACRRGKCKWIKFSLDKDSRQEQHEDLHRVAPINVNMQPLLDLLKQYAVGPRRGGVLIAKPGSIVLHGPIGRSPSYPECAAYVRPSVSAPRHVIARGRKQVMLHVTKVVESDQTEQADWLREALIAVNGMIASRAITDWYNERRLFPWQCVRRCYRLGGRCLDTLQTPDRVRNKMHVHNVLTSTCTLEEVFGRKMLEVMGGLWEKYGNWKCVDFFTQSYNGYKAMEIVEIEEMEESV